jgi:hypothetical protein
MTIPQNIKEGLIIVGIVVVGLWILLPKAKRGINSPKVADDKKLKDIDNAKVVLDAYLNAVEAGERKNELDKLNSIFADEYGLRVFRTKDGKYVARTSSGKDVLMTK